MDDKEYLKESIGTPVIASRLHWGNSSNVLCNYMKKPEFLDMILKNQAIIPRYVIEPLQYLNIPSLEKIAFPMTCFCDIPFSKVNSHMTQYGNYGIALDKATVIEKFKVQPIHYMSGNSLLMDDFREAFSKFYKTKRNLPEDISPLLDYMLSTLMYMKPISGYRETGDEAELYIFQDECEWRYIPPEFPPSLHKILKRAETTKKGCDTYSEVLVHHPETWINFAWEDVKYIIVPDEVASKRVIETIRELSMDDSQKYLLISKIEISKQFAEDLV